jgi:hypothetical protein
MIRHSLSCDRLEQLISKPHKTVVVVVEAAAAVVVVGSSNSSSNNNSSSSSISSSRFIVESDDGATYQLGHKSCSRIFMGESSG